jgi:hypothetical protein
MNKIFTSRDIEKFKIDTEEIKNIYKKINLKEINNVCPLPRVEIYLYIILVVLGFYLIFEYIKNRKQ